MTTLPKCSRKSSPWRRTLPGLFGFRCDVCPGGTISAGDRARCRNRCSIRPTVEVYNNLGTAYFSMRKFDEAALNFEEGLKLDDKNWLALGKPRRRLFPGSRKTAKAGDAYREAIRLTDGELRVNPRDGRDLAYPGDLSGDDGAKSRTALDPCKARCAFRRKARRAISGRHGTQPLRRHGSPSTVASKERSAAGFRQLDNATRRISIIWGRFSVFRLYYAALSSEGALRHPKLEKEITCRKKFVRPIRWDRKRAAYSSRYTFDESVTSTTKSSTSDRAVATKSFGIPRTTNSPSQFPITPFDCDTFVVPAGGSACSGPVRDDAPITNYLYNITNVALAMSADPGVDVRR